jgi:hypothetical protein
MSETKAAALYAHGWEKGAEPFAYQDDNNIPEPPSSILPPCSLAGENDNSNTLYMTPLKPSLTPTPQPLCNAADHQLSPQDGTCGGML